MSRVTIQLVASLDGFIARKDGRVGWLETSDHFEAGGPYASEFVEDFLRRWRDDEARPASVVTRHTAND